MVANVLVSNVLPIRGARRKDGAALKHSKAEEPPLIIEKRPRGGEYCFERVEKKKVTLSLVHVNILSFRK